MTAAWKLAAEARLASQDTPSVLTTGMLQAMVGGGVNAPSLSTLNRWQQDLVASAKLRVVIKGVYLNQLRDRNVSPAAAANWIRNRSVVSLAWVLEQAGITNNFGDTITCIIPTDVTWTTPQIGDRMTAAGTFRFFSMPAKFSDEGLAKFEDIQDLRFDYRRATPEKAFLDWIYLGASSKSRLSPPPLDLDIEQLDAKRIKRLSKSMDIELKLAQWMQRYQAFQQDEDVRENSATRWRL